MLMGILNNLTRAVISIVGGIVIGIGMGAFNRGDYITFGLGVMCTIWDVLMMIQTYKEDPKDEG